MAGISHRYNGVKFTFGPFAALAILLVLPGCVTPSGREKIIPVTSATITTGSPYWKYAQKFADRDPVEEAGEAFARNRFSIYSANGYALYYPGLDYGMGRALAAQYGATALPGFSNSPSGRDQIAYMRFAEQYAAAYNREIRRLLTESGKLRK